MTEAQKTADYIAKNTVQEAKKLKDFLTQNRIIIVPLAQKMGGKTYYLQYFTDLLGKERFETVFTGEMIRMLKKAGIEEVKAQLTQVFSNQNSQEKLSKIDQITQEILNSNSAKLISDEIIFALIRDKISSIEYKNSIILDGVPRSVQQIESIRKLEQDLNMKAYFFYFDTNYEVLDIRAESRRVCPVCGYSKNIVSSPTNRVIHKGNTFVLICDACAKQAREVQMVQKLGDDKKEDILKARNDYEAVMKALEASMGNEFIRINTCQDISDYYGPIEEINKAFMYSLDPLTQQVRAIAEPQVVQLADGTKIYAKSPEFAVVKMVKQLANRI